MSSDNHVPPGAPTLVNERVGRSVPPEDAPPDLLPVVNPPPVKTRDEMEKLLKTVQKECETGLDSGGLITRGEHLKRSWELMLGEIAPDVGPNDYWLDTTVLAYAPLFASFRTRCTPGRNGLCRASMVQKWVSDLTVCIAQFAHDPCGTKCGDNLLQNGLWQRLNDTLRNVIKELDLVRHDYPELVGGEEFQPVADQAL